MEGLSKKEQRIYEGAGGGERGERAVIARRNFLEDYFEIQRAEMRRLCYWKFFPRNEKNYINPATIEDDYE